MIQRCAWRARLSPTAWTAATRPATVGRQTRLSPPPGQSRRQAAGRRVGARAGKDAEERAARSVHRSSVSTSALCLFVPRRARNAGEHDRGLAIRPLRHLSRVAGLARAAMVAAAGAGLARTRRKARGGNRGRAMAGDDRLLLDDLAALPPSGNVARTMRCSPIRGEIRACARRGLPWDQAARRCLHRSTRCRRRRRTNGEARTRDRGGAAARRHDRARRTLRRALMLNSLQGGLVGMVSIRASATTILRHPLWEATASRPATARSDSQLATLIAFGNKSPARGLVSRQSPCADVLAGGCLENSRSRKLRARAQKRQKIRRRLAAADRRLMPLATCRKENRRTHAAARIAASEVRKIQGRSWRRRSGRGAGRAGDRAAPGHRRARGDFARWP